MIRAKFTSSGTSYHLLVVPMSFREREAITVVADPTMWSASTKKKLLAGDPDKMVRKRAYQKMLHYKKPDPLEFEEDEAIDSASISP